MKTLLKVLAVVFALVIVSAIFFGVRGAQARQLVDGFADAPLPLSPPFQETTRLEILPLYEEVSSDPNLLSGHGVAYLIRTDAGTLLLDLGNNPDRLEELPLAQNMAQLELDWAEIDAVMISHLHPDHVGGSAPWWSRTLAADPSGSIPRYIPDSMNVNNSYVIDAPFAPLPDVTTTGIIPYPEVFPLSLREPVGREQALVVHVSGAGLVLITGCGHPGVQTLVTRAEALYGQPVVGVVGGLHYGNASEEELKPDIEFLRSRDLALIALSPHDSSIAVQTIFRETFPDAYQEILVGNKILFSQES